MTLTIGEYTLLPHETLGEGNFGVVYKGFKNSKPDSFVAIKVLKMKQLNANSRRIIDRETENIRKLNQENIIRLLDIVNQKDEKLYYVFEFCQSDLEKEIKKIDKSKIYVSKGIFSEDHLRKTMTYTKQILDAFREISRNSLIHRDIKPSNILLCDGAIKIADFGFSRIVEDIDQLRQYTRACTPVYSCPEILMNQKFSSKCDVFSCGVVIFELFFGQHPFYSKETKGLISLLQNIRKSPIFPENNLPSPVIELLSGMLGESEEKRLSWEQVFKQFDAVDLLDGGNQVQNAELVPEVPSKTYKKEGKTDYISSVKELLGEKITSNSADKTLEARLQMTNLIIQRPIRDILNNKDFFGEINENKLLTCLYIILAAELEQDMEFFRKFQKCFTNPEEKKSQITSSLNNAKKYGEDLKAKLLAQIKQTRFKTSENRAFELLLSGSNEVDVSQLRDWFREIIINILKKMNLPEKLEKESLKFNELLLLFNVIMFIESPFLFCKPQTLTEAFIDPNFYHDESNDQTKSQLYTRISNWFSNLL